jgi:hypothetical protein
MKKTAEPADLAMNMGRNFREAGERFQWSSVLLVVAIIALVALTVWLLVRYVNFRETRGFHNPKRLFQELCAAHGLNRHRRNLIARLAAAHQLEYPAALFLAPERFDVAQLDASWQSQRAALEELRDAIFGRRLAEEEVAL